MKKVLIIALLFVCGFSNAQVTFRPGLRGGLNFSHFTKGDFNNNYYYNSNPYNTNPSDDFSSKTDFYLGFFGALRLTKHYTLQPELDYSRQGSNYKSVNQYFDGINVVSQSFSGKLEVSYLSIAVVNKFSFSDKFNIQLGPAIDFVVENNFSTESDVDLTFILGAGYNVTKNLGIEARIKKGVIPAFYNSSNSYSDSNHTNVVISIGAAYTFDVK